MLGSLSDAMGVTTGSKYTEYSPTLTHLIQFYANSSIKSILHETFSLPPSLRKWWLPLFCYSFSLPHIILQRCPLVSSSLMHTSWPWKASSPNTKISFNKPQFKYTQQNPGSMCYRHHFNAANWEPRMFILGTPYLFCLPFLLHVLNCTITF